jgi:phosphoribosylaminoimidazolecarboxamide formyltransferase/IMP cyclohydrolase
VKGGADAWLAKDLDVPLVLRHEAVNHGKPQSGTLAILFAREKDRVEAHQLSIEPIDMVVCNLYDFAGAVQNNLSETDLIEHIDIGGPTMIRAAAKNFKYVAAVTYPGQYKDLIDELQETGGALAFETRKSLMLQAFQLTAEYESMIATTLNAPAGQDTYSLTFISSEKLRYGENPHQTARFYRRPDLPYTLAHMVQHRGKELSYNNIVDIEAACYAVKDLPNPACAIIKHTNPCGLGTGLDTTKLLELAWQGDPLSAFGSVISFNSKVRKEMLTFLALDHPQKNQRKFVEVVVAPAFSPDAIEYLSGQKNLRIIELDAKRLPYTDDTKILAGGLLRQSCDPIETTRCEWVTQNKPDTIPTELLFFGVNAARAVKSNAIVLVREISPATFQLLGMGAGQPNRVTSVKIAVERMDENLERVAKLGKLKPQAFYDQVKPAVICISDAFFPFPDSIDLLGQAGIKTVVSPGGSNNDKAVIGRCNELGVCMGFTGVRHFRH